MKRLVLWWKPKRRTASGHKSSDGSPATTPSASLLAGAAAGRDAIEEPGRDIGVVQLRRLAHDEVGVGRIGDRAVDQLAHPDRIDDRRALRGQLGELLETVEILG